MGMFDSLYEGERGDQKIEWQTKAYYCNLDGYWVGDEMPPLIGDGPGTYQVEILGGRTSSGRGDCRRSLATVIDGVLVNIDNERARSLPLVNYSGHLIANPPEERESSDVNEEERVG